MIRTSVLQQNYNLLLQENALRSMHWRTREQECFSLLQRCKCMEEFKQVHALILKHGFIHYADNLVARCALSEWGSMEYACSIFQQFEKPSSFLFNTLIRGHVMDGDPNAAILLYREMQERGVHPDNFTYPSLLKGCSLLSALAEGKQIHGHVFKFGFESDVFVQNSLITMYGRSGEILFSCKVFENIDRRTVASWSSLISCHASLGLWVDCVRLFGIMTCEGWRADESTLVSVLSSCTHLGALDLGRFTHGTLMRNMTGLNVIVQTCLVNMYVKCGSVDKGISVFQQMPRKNKLSYSIMISGLAMHGRTKEALKMFSDMLDEGLKPDDRVYLGVLSACSNAGLVDKGLKYFNRMKLEHQIEPTIQHYGCLVNLLGHAGMLNEAYDQIIKMPVEPNVVVWRSLLSACVDHQNLDLGEIVSRNLFQLNSHNESDYVLLSNLYARAHRWEDVAITRKEMVDRGLNQMPGFTQVEVKRKMHKFVSQDKSHPQSNAVYEMIHQMEWQLRFGGYSPDLSQVLLDVDEEEKRQLLRAHSQKLALGFALINTSQGSTIRIMRNLRMCKDCHTYTKLISRIYERSIFVRDRNRFHHFKDGTCSCRDC